MLDPTALPDTLRARTLTRQADWAPKSEVGLVECGLLNPGPPARLPVRPSPPNPPNRLSARPPVCASSVHLRIHALWAPSAHSLHCLHPFRPRPRPFRPIRSSARPLDRFASARPPVRSMQASSATSAPPTRDNRRYIYPTPPPRRSSSSSQFALGPESLLRL